MKKSIANVCLSFTLLYILIGCKTGKEITDSKHNSKDSVGNFISEGKCERWGKECDGDVFNGCILREIKLNFVEADYETFKNTKELLASLTKGSNIANEKLGHNRGRSFEENRNVIIQEAYLFMISKESDNDYHLILGDNPDYQKSHLFSAEIAGLPENSSDVNYDRLKKVRDKFKKNINPPQNCSATKKHTTDLTAKPNKITIRGSILFDNQHKHGGSGYSDVKTKTAWEIHPVLDFDLL